ncbi:SUMF1/EgtB/PvdO family nonheme iron enzyme [Treponema sp.]|uniref:SUMF1/EgtB/PvdO family nonheme iron enzyme n=1 Tax=Treponema sp. TaxID=166 RepID=UPI0025D9705A|nr:SUMF1/EgtB/PvdO family nonheme iron enzyme [Treponema sp.]MCR5218107.1 SUMF1/EgtB/PvdO family nonheme iron enzyme [Treponema sp.]
MRCKNCGSEILDSFRFCPSCGQNVEEQILNQNLADIIKGQQNSSESSHGERYLNSGEDNPAVRSDIIPKMILIEGGSFVMGQSEFQRNVLLNTFYMSETPVTQKQYQAVTSSNPSKLKGADRPVESVNWCEALIFCNLLSMSQGLVPCYSLGMTTDLLSCKTTDPLWKRVSCNFAASGYRLPTEAEWEYAARGGKNHNPSQFSGSDDINKVAWYGENSDVHTHAVSSKKSNSLGLYDMCGNVAEWCWDYMEELPLMTMTNPCGPDSGNCHVKRGGSWLDDMQQCTVYFRSGSAPAGKSSTLGFRLCRSFIEGIM